ncbi:MAG: Ig-like domain-containing protein [Prevotella sp.]|nr:Ig-like domain-containing protein [Prevotella sp.]
MKRAVLSLTVLMLALLSVAADNRPVVTGLQRQQCEIFLAYNSVIALWGDPVIAPSVETTEGYDGELIYESDNEDVVEVDDDGQLTAKSPGTATITIIGTETWKFKKPEAVIYTVTIQARNGDLNYDGKVDAADIISFINITTSINAANNLVPNADVNRDGTVDAADILSIINIIKNNVSHNTDATGRLHEGVEAVDLGLPSGTLWANMNIGALTPEGYGLYFAWGETTGYTGYTSDGRLFDIPNYRWTAEGQTENKYYAKYQIEDGYTECCWYDADGNFIGDGKSVLDAEDDAAVVLWGGDWGMPTDGDIEELLTCTTSEWTIQNDVYGCRLTSKFNGKSIFMPAAGQRRYMTISNEGRRCEFWTKSINPYSSSDAVHLIFTQSMSTWGFSVRYIGKTIRPVQKKQ